MNRKPLHLPFVDAVIATARTAKKPTAKFVVRRLAKSMLESTRRTANAGIPPFVLANRDDENTTLMLARMEMAGKVAGPYSGISSWREACAWLNHAYYVIRHGPAPGIEDTLLTVFSCVNDLSEAVDFDWLAVCLGYSSIDEANAQAPA